MVHAHFLLKQLVEADDLPEASKRALRALMHDGAHDGANSETPDPLQAPAGAPSPSHRSYTLLSWGDDSALSALPQAAPHIAATPARAPELPARYRPIARAGVGGMGEVWCVWDHHTERMIALKMLRDTLGQRQDLADRFIAEARISARLSHPNIVSVHTIGTLDDGRPYFTMDLIQGAPMDRVIDRVHRLSERHGRWTRTDDGWSLRRLVEAVVQICEAAAAAHALGILHRDIKPQNVIVAPKQRVWLVDFGLARVSPDAATAPHTLAAPSAHEARQAPHQPHPTRLGSVIGTPSYMPPEQAAGRHDALDARSDVYALGALLFHCLTGHAPFASTHPSQTLRRVLASPHLDPQNHTPLPLPPTLIEAVIAATQHNPSDRTASASALAASLQRWLEGSRARERASALVMQAQASDRQRATLQRNAEDTRANALALLDAIAPTAPERDRFPGWSLLDEAQALEANAQTAANATQNHLNAALTLVPSLESAHAMMAREALRGFKEAEATSDQDALHLHRAVLDLHLEALPVRHAERVRMERYLEGEGAVTVVTEPAGAEVEIYRYEERHRRLVEVHVKTVGPTPIVELPLPMGSYLLVLRKDGFAPTRYPVFIERLTHWHGVPPGDTEPLPIPLIPQHHLSQNALYVPHGPFWAGSRTPIQYQILPHRMWVDGFVIDRFPVTYQDYADFLGALLRSGVSEDTVLSHIPAAGAARRPLLTHDPASGTFQLADNGIHTPPPDAPVNFITQRDALSYAAWRRDTTGKPWRLPMELEWEKAARGVDGRDFPWGHHTHPSWSLNSSADQQSRTAPVDSFPLDESPYGLRGAAGNSCDICLDVWDTDAPPPERLEIPPPPHLEQPRYAIRGGSSWFRHVFCHCNQRGLPNTVLRMPYVGIRLVRSVSASPTPTRHAPTP